MASGSGIEPPVIEGAAVDEAPAPAQPAAAAAAAAEEGGGGAKRAAAASMHPLDLPAANVQRVVKSMLDGSVKVSKEALQAFNRSAAVFILYLTAASNEVAKSRKRTTIREEDIFEALKDLDFEEFVPELEQLHNEIQQENQGKRKAAHAAEARAAKEAKLASPDGGGGGGENMSASGDGDMDEVVPQLGAPTREAPEAQPAAAAAAAAAAPAAAAAAAGASASAGDGQEDDGEQFNEEEFM
ncbi:unnamed protein product [Vitrella brassicaformis CCMP3155]|uniref:Transcription factor CBF/NF-Y/archaeal histone domain-containing protein n=1 Tax=Vitrella brassicaformis (strain CCMP3155) TaxID=1169540 RepID=A0A0G4F9U0_VITBC|nr:unnamed protein product [Vitrella brassicaformis CCMP3155]|eukprot:CEM09150.1 unnamed protein product [Vitrella brassicaformis CCMP3155]